MNRHNLKIIAGIDDATKCPCIGSIFIAGVSADQLTIEKWQKIGVKDSKVITPKKRERLAKIIKETALAFNIRQITPAQMTDLTFNLNDWEMLTCLQILNKLNKVNNINEAYIDNWEVSYKMFVSRFQSLSKRKNDIKNKKIRLNFDNFKYIKFIPEHKADQNYTIVGAASILAKTASDKQYRRYKKIYGDFGSGSPADPQTRRFVWQHRKNPVPIIRTSWLTYKVISQLKNINDDIIIAKNKTKIKIS
ncbi:MAG: ribonuclease HII [Candidatus Buchananbacteria bacterium]|nr:ribonuclease HII [Candidatus Buchananbacteria bacterium]